MSDIHGYPVARAVTSGPKYHYFGYYDKFPWDASGRCLLGLETRFMDRPPTGDDRAVIGRIALQEGNRWEPIAETKAWNWQQGAMLHWLPTAPDRKIIYNDREGDRFVSVIRISHFDWRNANQILAWARRYDIGDRYFLFTDRTDQIEVVGEGTLTCDGHCSYSPDRRWILTDTYPDAERMRTLILYRPEDDRRVDIGRFFAPKELDGEIRCDLHPRWSRDGTQVCFDSVHEGTRQMYIVDVRDIVGAA